MICSKCDVKLKTWPKWNADAVRKLSAARDASGPSVWLRVPRSFSHHDKEIAFSVLLAAGFGRIVIDPHDGHTIVRRQERTSCAVCNEVAA